MWHLLVSSFGIAAAILVVGGYVILQWQRNRYRYQLMQSALEKGMTEFPEQVPFWFLSLRQGAAILTLGLGLLAVGGIVYSLVWGIELPNVPITQSITSVRDKESPPRGPEEKPRPPHADRPKPPPPNPALERWRRAENQKTVGLATMGCGFVLALLGIVRIGFARVERKYINSE